MKETKNSSLLYSLHSGVTPGEFYKRVSPEAANRTEDIFMDYTGSDYTVPEVLQFVAENDVKFIRLAFCDLFGVQKNISIMPGELADAFKNGFFFDGSSADGFATVNASDLLIVPDSRTLSVLPWRPSHGQVVRMFCDVCLPDGTLLESASRSILRKAVAAAEEMGYSFKIGTESEFYLFETNEKGYPTKTPHDNGGYCDISPLDKGENVRREICLSLEEMNLNPFSSRHEAGPGQNKIDFKYADALTAADNFLAFKATVKNIAARNGLYASFMPKPLPGESGSALHINLSLTKNGKNLFRSGSTEHSAEAESFMAGILSRIAEITVFLNPTTNSYKRFGEFSAPKYISWSHQNRSQLIRIPASTGASCYMELRSPDAACNPYIAFALLIYAGLDGIRNSKKLCPPHNINLYEADDEVTRSLTALPVTLEKSLSIAEKSDFIKTCLPENTREPYFNYKRKEWDSYTSAEDAGAFEDSRYFNFI